MLYCYKVFERDTESFRLCEKSDEEETGVYFQWNIRKRKRQF